MPRDTPMQESKVFQNCWPRLHLAQVHFDESAAKAYTLLGDALGLWYFLCSKMFFLCFKGPCFWVKSRKYTLLRFIRWFHQVSAIKLMLVNPSGCQTITIGYDSSAINSFEILHRGKGIYTKESNSLQRFTIFPVGNIMINDILQEQWTIYNNIFSALPNNASYFMVF